MFNRVELAVRVKVVYGNGRVEVEKWRKQT